MHTGTREAADYPHKHLSHRRGSQGCGDATLVSKGKVPYLIRCTFPTYPFFMYIAKKDFSDIFGGGISPSSANLFLGFLDYLDYKPFNPSNPSNLKNQKADFL